MNTKTTNACINNIEITVLALYTSSKLISRRTFRIFYVFCLFYEYDNSCIFYTPDEGFMLKLCQGKSNSRKKYIRDTCATLSTPPSSTIKTLFVWNSNKSENLLNFHAFISTFFRNPSFCPHLAMLVVSFPLSFSAKDNPHVNWIEFSQSLRAKLVIFRIE